MGEDTNFENHELESIAKYLYTDELGNYRGVVNPHFLADHNITCVGQFIKCLLDAPESERWSGWIGIWNWHSEYGTPRIYYVGSESKPTPGDATKSTQVTEAVASKTTKEKHGYIPMVTDYRKDWLETGLVYAKFRSITYVDNFGRIDWLIQLVEDVDVRTE